jgi:hypothetical protein
MVEELLGLTLVSGALGANNFARTASRWSA